MPEALFDLSRAHRWFAVEFNNEAWDAIEAENFVDADLLIDTAHASCRHWRAVGNAPNYQRSQALLTTLYARLGYANAAIRHAERCLTASEANGDALTAWDRACAYGSAALAYAVAGNEKRAISCREKTVMAVQSWDNPEEVALFHKLFGPAER